MVERTPARVPKFSIVSIRPSSSEGHFAFKWTGTGLVESGNTLFWLIEMAYDFKEQRSVERAPSWIGEQRYDLIAKVDDEDQQAFSALTDAARASMLREVLVERFSLKYHLEPRIFPEYALILKKPGQAPSALVPSDPQDAVAPQWKISRPYKLEARGISMHVLCDLLLSTEARQLVVDRTGLEGKFTFTVRWRRVDMNVDPSTAADADNAPDIFTAVQEQLGLKMVPTREPVQVMVIDSIDHPSPN